MICPKCGAENENRNVCRQCGAFIQGKKLRRYDLDPKERRRQRTRQAFLFGRSCLVSAVFLVIAIAIISVIFFLLFQLLAQFMDLGPSPATDERGQVLTDLSGQPIYPTWSLAPSKAQS